MKRRIQLAVNFKGHTARYFTVPEGQGWHVNTDTREIVIGSGVPRTLVPLDSVLWYDIVNIGEDE